MKLNSSLAARENINDCGGRMTLAFLFVCRSISSSLRLIKCAEGVRLNTAFSFSQVFYPRTELPPSRQTPTRRTSPLPGEGFGAGRGKRQEATAAAAAATAAAASRREVTEKRLSNPGSTVPPWCRAIATGTPAR